MQKLFKCEYGSRLYGTNTPTSDLDIKIVYLPELNDLLLGNRVGNNCKKTNTQENTKNTSEDIDIEFIPLQSFANDFFSGQTYALELAYAIDYTEANQEIFNPLFVKFCHELRENFLTSNIEAMMGYSVSQANLYSDKGKRLNALNEVLEVINQFPQDIRMEYLASDLKDKIAPVIEKYPEYVAITEYAINNEGDLRLCLIVLEKTLPYSNTFKINLNPLLGMLKKYGSRVKEASVNNADWKALLHANRIVSEGIQLFQTKKLVFPLSNEQRAFLKNIKAGNVNREQITTDLNFKLEYLKDLSMAGIFPERTPELNEKFQEFLIGYLRKFYL